MLFHRKNSGSGYNNLFLILLFLCVCDFYDIILGSETRNQEIKKVKYRHRRDDEGDENFIALAPDEADIFNFPSFMGNSEHFDGNDGADDEDTDEMESDGGDDKLFLPIFNETSSGGAENVINDKSQFYDPFKVFKYLGDKIMGKTSTTPQPTTVMSTTPLTTTRRMTTSTTTTSTTTTTPPPPSPRPHHQLTKQSLSETPQSPDAVAMRMDKKSQEIYDHIRTKHKSHHHLKYKKKHRKYKHHNNNRHHSPIYQQQQHHHAKNDQKQQPQQDYQGRINFYDDSNQFEIMQNTNHHVDGYARDKWPHFNKVKKHLHHDDNENLPPYIKKYNRRNKQLINLLEGTLPPKYEYRKHEPKHYHRRKNPHWMEEDLFEEQRPNRNNIAQVAFETTRSPNELPGEGVHIIYDKSHSSEEDKIRTNNYKVSSRAGQFIYHRVESAPATYGSIKKQRLPFVAITDRKLGSSKARRNTVNSN